MAPPGSDTTGDTRTIALAIALVVLVGVGLAALNPLISVALERAGVSAMLSGASASLAGLGTVAVVALMPRLTRALGLVGVLGVALALASAVTLLFPLTSGLGVWSVLRFFMGAAIGAIFTLSEFWINVAAPPARRGMVMGLYATTLYAGFALGPLLLGAFMGEDGSGLAPWFITAALLASGLLPLWVAREHAPPLQDHASAKPWRFIRAAPAATLGAFVFGVVETGAMLLLPVYGLRLGLSAPEAAWLVALFTLGNVALQIPLGLLSDRMPRLPLLGLLALSSAACLLGLLAPVEGLARALLLVLAGGLSGGIYPVALALLGERFSDSDLAAANGAVVALYSVGLVVGPPLLGLGMDALGARGLPLALGGLLALYALMALARKKAHAKP